MGSERLSHMFTMKDPTYKKAYSSSSKDEAEKSSSEHSMSHTSGTQPVSLSNGPKSSSSSSPIIKPTRKHNSKYKKLSKLYSRQLSHIGTTLNAIESLSKSIDNDQYKMILSNKKRVGELNEEFENLRNSPSLQDHIHFDQMKNDIEQLMNDLKSYKMNNHDPDSTNAVDSLVGLPLDVSDSDENEKNDEEKTLIYF